MKGLEAGRVKNFIKRERERERARTVRQQIGSEIKRDKREENVGDLKRIERMRKQTKKERQMTGCKRRQCSFLSPLSSLLIYDRRNKDKAE